MLWLRVYAFWWASFESLKDKGDKKKRNGENDDVLMISLIEERYKKKKRRRWRRVNDWVIYCIACRRRYEKQFWHLRFYTLELYIEKHGKQI